MQKPSPKKNLMNIAPRLATVTLGAICLFDASPLEAQSPTSSRATIINSAASESGKVAGKLLSERSRPTANNPTGLQKYLSRLQADSKPVPRLPYVGKAETKSQFKTAANKAVKPKAALAVKNEITPPKQSKNTTPTFKNLPLRTPAKSNAITAQKRVARKLPLPFQPIANQPADASQPPQSTENGVLPTIVIRPSAALSKHANECVFEINELRSSNDVSLKVAIPDSVTMIEVVPNRNSNTHRNFRITMDQGVETELANRQPTSKHPAQHEPPQPQPTAALPLDSPESVARTSRQGFLRNPFFKDNVAQSNIKSNVESNIKSNVESKIEIAVESPVEKVASKTLPSVAPEQSTQEKIKLPENKKRVGVRGFLKRISHASSSEESEPLATRELSYEPEEQTLQHAHSFATTIPVIAAQIVGPTEINVSQTADFMVGIVNPMKVTSRNLEVELDIPRGLKVVLLDQAADFNERTGTLHWKVKEIKPGDRAQLRYRVVSLRSGKQRQRVAVRIKNDLVDRHNLLTLAKLNIDAGASELPFDSDLPKSQPLESIGPPSEKVNRDVGDNEFPVEKDSRRLPVDSNNSNLESVNLDAGASELPFEDETPE